MRTLFSEASVVTVDENNTVFDNAYVLVEDEYISYVGMEKPKEKADMEINCRGKVLMPGLVNAHTHLPMSLLRGYADNFDLNTWLYDYVFPAEGRMDRRSAKAGIELSLAEMISNGITCYADMYDFCDVMAESTVQSGISANIARGVVCFDKNAFDPDNYYSRKEQKELLENWQNAGDGRIKVDASIHGEYTSFPTIWRHQVEWAKEHNLGMHLHLCETKAETEGCIERYGKTPVQVLAEAGIFDVRCIAAHCVYLTEEDMKILSEKQVTATHCPVSNLKLGSGIAEVGQLAANNINIALGTDGVSSNNNHDLFQELNMSALIHRGVKCNPLEVSAEQSIRMATVNGAKALGRNAGVIEKGKYADIILLDFDRPHLTPNHSVVSNIVFSARGSDVCLTMARGKILYEKGEWKTLDVEKIRREVNEYGAPLVAGKEIRE